LGKLPLVNIPDNLRSKLGLTLIEWPTWLFITWLDWGGFAMKSWADGPHRRAQDRTMHTSGLADLMQTGRQV
jgi:hypothetical protein